MAPMCPLQRSTHAQRLGDSRRQVVGVGDAGQFDPAHTLRIVAAVAAEQMLGQQRLADAAGADERDQAVARHQLGQGGQLLVTSEQRRELAWQMGLRPACRHRCGRRRLRGTVATACGQRSRETVAPARNGGDDVRAEQPTQRADLGRDIVLFHHQARPDEVKQLLLGDEVVAAPRQHDQHVKSPAAQRHGLAVDAQQTLIRVELEVVEAQAIVGAGRWQGQSYRMAGSCGD